MPTAIEPTAGQTGDIMIVDDNPANLKLLEDMLIQGGHEVRSFPLGRLALAAAAHSPPSLVLLDINMPEMNGYEVCARFKAEGPLAGIPVIFLSALNETPDKVEAFRTGAVDYISKPFQLDEVQARVKTHLQLNQLQKQLTLQNERLEETVAQRTSELAEAQQRLTILDHSKSEFLRLISHELRTPLHGLLGVSELVLADMASTPQNVELQEMYLRSRQRLLSIVDDALLLTQIDVSGEEFRLAPISLHHALESAMPAAAVVGASQGVRILSTWTHLPDRLVLGHEELLRKAFEALLVTAIKFSAENGRVEVSTRSDGGAPAVIIRSQGKTIPAAAIAGFFDLFAFGEASTPGGDLGLGPSAAYRILSLFRATVTVRNEEPPGIQLTITLQSAAPSLTEES